MTLSWVEIIFGIVVSTLSFIGMWTLVSWIVAFYRRFVSGITDLSNTLKDAAEIARAYREDVQILKQIAQAAQTPNSGEEPESIIPQEPQYGSRMPSPYFDRFPTKPIEPEAPFESVANVDVTSSDDDFIEQEKNSAAADFETQERMKAAMREADQKRLKELVDLSGEE